MNRLLFALAAAGLLAAGLAMSTNAASASPLSGALALGKAMPNTIETVQWRGGGWGRPGWRGGCCWRGPGWGAVGAGVVAGAIVGAAVATRPAVVYAPPPAVVYAPPPAVYAAPPPGYGPR
jgi:hypothetical protein